MSAFNTSSDVGEVWIGRRCFGCRRPFVVNEVFVLWNGSDDEATSIGLHQPCARHLGCELICDSFSPPRNGSFM